MRTLSLAIVCAAGLAGVSGCNRSSSTASEGSPVTTPPAGPSEPPLTTPATPSEIQAFEAFAANPNSATVISASSTSTSTPTAVSFAQGAAGDGSIDVTVGATVYTLTGDISSGVPIFTDPSGAKRVSVKQVARQSDVALALIRTRNALLLNQNLDPTGFSPLGAATSTADLDALIGAVGASASYTGTSSLVAIHQNNLRDSAEGDLQLFVDFETATFVGSMDLKSAATGGQNFEITDVNILFDTGTISAGVLSADLEIAPADPTTHTLMGNPTQLFMDPNVVGKLTGSFFGPNAQNVGGTFNFSGTEPDQQGLMPPQKIEVQGGFIGTQ